MQNKFWILIAWFLESTNNIFSSYTHIIYLCTRYADIGLMPTICWVWLAHASVLLCCNKMPIQIVWLQRGSQLQRGMPFDNFMLMTDDRKNPKSIHKNWPVRFKQRSSDGWNFCSHSKWSDRTIDTIVEHKLKIRCNVLVVVACGWVACCFYLV